MAGRKRRGKYATDETVGVMDPRGIEPPHRNLAAAIDRSGIERQQFMTLMDVSEKTLNAWIGGSPKRDPQKRLTNGELIRAAHLLRVNIPYLLDLTEDQAQPKDGAPMPGNLGQYEKGRRLLKKYVGIARDPDKVIRFIEHEEDCVVRGDSLDAVVTQEQGYQVPRFTTPHRIGAEPAGVWEFYEDEDMAYWERGDVSWANVDESWDESDVDKRLSAWEKELYRVCGLEEHGDEKFPMSDLLFYLDIRDEKTRPNYIKAYKEQTAARLMREAEAIPGDYRDLAGVCVTMLDELRRNKDPELVDLACMVVGELHERISYSKRGN